MLLGLARVELSKGILEFMAQKDGSMEVEALKVDGHDILYQVAVFREED
jgi:hypothetical protein